MSAEAYYIRVSGAWDTSPAIYLGPFDSYSAAREAIDRSGATLGESGTDPKRDVRVSILDSAEARVSGRRDRHTLPPRTVDAVSGFGVPADAAQFTMIYYRCFGRH